jgi:hypothetical protein
MHEFAFAVAAGVVAGVITSLLGMIVKRVMAKVRKAKNGSPRKESPF